jgi:hypothetical protein
MGIFSNIFNKKIKTYGKRLHGIAREYQPKVQKAGKCKICSMNPDNIYTKVIQILGLPVLVSTLTIIIICIIGHSTHVMNDDNDKLDYGMLWYWTFISGFLMFGIVFIPAWYFFAHTAFINYCKDLKC